MTSKIGNRGFTLIEVMTASAVLSLGVVLVYEAFFTSLNSFNYCSNYLGVSPWADEKIWHAQDVLGCAGPSADIDREGEFKKRNKTFKWTLSHNLVKGTEDLYKIDLMFAWQEGQRNVRISRSAYAIYETS